MFNLLTYYLPVMPIALIYMLQQVEYHPLQFMKWLMRFPATNKVMHRQKLVMTRKAQLLLVVAYATWAIPLLVGIIWMLMGELVLGWVSFALAPLICIATILLITLLAQKIIVDPTQAKEIKLAKRKLDTMTTKRIAIIGSYGKTTMKELLQTILGEGRVVAATPGNKNVLISHARWINQKLTGDEEVLVFEYGEGRPGDIARFASLSRPDIAVLTGLAPAHMEEYGSLDAVVDDFMEITGYVDNSNIYTNSESSELVSRVQGFHKYSVNGVNGWKVANIDASISGTKFSLKKDDRVLNLHSSLIGLHQIGLLCAAVDIAAHLGLSDEQIKDGVANTKPFKHRMQPYQLGGAWIIDDTYNGNLEGARAGLKLLKELENSGRKIYITPGFVEQGDLSEQVHQELGQVIAESHPDKVVLMKNSTTEHIEIGLDRAGFSGELLIEGNPLDFYNNLEHFVAAGDIVLMQNDWPDSYQ